MGAGALEAAALMGVHREQFERVERLVYRVEDTYHEVLVADEAVDEPARLVGPDGATFEDARDALGELTNLVGGTVKTVLSEESFVGIPEVTVGTNNASRPVHIDHGLGRFAVQFSRG